MRRLLPFLPASAVALAILCAIVGEGPRADGPPPGQKGPAEFDINAGKRALYKIAVPRPIGDPASANTFAEVVSGDLYSSGWFKVIDPRSFLANLAAEGVGISLPDWRNIGAEGVAKAQSAVYNGELSLDCKLYEVGKGPYAVVEKTYKGPASQVRAFAHAWAAEVVKWFAKEDSFFTSQIAFSSSPRAGIKDVYVMDYDGFGLHKVTDNGSQNILPAWNPNGSSLVFTSFLRGNPDLYTVGTGGGRPKRIANYPGVNMGATFSPDGGRIAATLSQDGNPEIYLLDTAGKIVKRLTDSPFIDSSPAWSPDGGQLAFVSNRFGSPQVWLMSSSGADQHRLTTRGNYNQEPTWCPKCDTPTIAYTARDEKANFDIFTIDVKNPQTGVVRITENQGQNEHATWAPTGRAMAFASSRGGVWVSTADGKLQRQVSREMASTPVWGPRR